jgi:hypothetical protein
MEQIRSIAANGAIQNLAMFTGRGKTNVLEISIYHAYSL